MDETKKYILECTRLYHPWLKGAYVLVLYLHSDLLERPCLGAQTRPHWQTMYRRWEGKEEKERAIVSMKNPGL